MDTSIVYTVVTRNLSGDEIANVNFFTTTSHNTSKYNPLLNIQHDACQRMAKVQNSIEILRKITTA